MYSQHIHTRQYSLRTQPFNDSGLCTFRLLIIKIILNKWNIKKETRTNVQSLFYGGQRWIRTTVPSREQIYSLSPLATRPSTLIRFCTHFEEICLRRDLNPWPLPYQGSALPLRYEGADYKRMPKIGIEPTTYGLQNRCSTIEPLRHRIIILRTYQSVKCQRYFLILQKFP